jgi:hypothetical protein
LLVTFSCLFYALFLFDTLGDAVGFQGALWVLIVVPLVPALLFATVASTESRSSSRAAESKPMAKELQEAGERGGGAGGAATEDIELSVVGTVSPVHCASEDT